MDHSVDDSVDDDSADDGDAAEAEEAEEEEDGPDLLALAMSLED